MKIVGALGTIFDEQGRVLLVRQTYAGNKWVLPGGTVAPGESPWDAAVREVKEETGLDVEIVRLVSVYYIQDTDAIGFQFLCRVTGGTVCVDGAEISDAAFFDPMRLPAPMTRNGRQRVIDALANCNQPFLRVFERQVVIEA